MYSLILSDEVVAAIDMMALRKGMSRSAMINSILAEYASLMTPEKRINNVLQCIEKLIGADESLVAFTEPNKTFMSVKSSLEYRYRPTIKYVLELYRKPDGAIGELTVTFRTQSDTLIAALTDFFRLFKKLEDTYTARYYKHGALRYELYENRFVRTIAIPEGKDYTPEQLGGAISEYVRMLDTLMKGYITGRLNVSALEKSYVAFLERGSGLI